MERKKYNRLLYIYEILNSGKILNTKKISQEFEVTTKTIYRDINDLKSYFKNENKPEYIEYDEEEGGYILKTKENNWLNKKDVLAISKVLLESRGFTKQEMKDFIQKLLANCVNKDEIHIKEIVGNELLNYAPLKHKDKIIDKMWDLSCAIKEKKLVEIEYLRVGKNGKLEDIPSNRILEPQGILFSEYYFYLIACIKGKGYEYPAIYRLDRIKKYKILKEGFKVNYKDRFKEGEFRNLIQFMQVGKLQTIKFRFKGTSIEAVLDRLPTAEILEENEGEYVVKAKVFGKGIKMWLLSQGDYIEVLEPKEFRDEIKSTISNMFDKYNSVKN